LQSPQASQPPADLRAADERMREALKLPEGFSDRFRLSDEMREMWRKVSPPSPPTRPSPPKPKRGGRPPDLNDGQIVRRITFLNRNPKIEMEDAYLVLRKLLGTDASDSTLWRRIWSKRKRKR
jgi:hypothetical protein